MEYAVAFIVAMFKHIKPQLFGLTQIFQPHQILEVTTNNRNQTPNANFIRRY